MVKHARQREHITLPGSGFPSGVARSPTLWRFLICSYFWGFPSLLFALVLVLPEVLWGVPSLGFPIGLPNWASTINTSPASANIFVTIVLEVLISLSLPMNILVLRKRNPQQTSHTLIFCSLI
jgi:hypothetical protein